MKKIFLYVKEKVWNFFFEHDGTKWTVKKRRAKITTTVLIAFISMIQFLKSANSSDLSKAYRPFCAGFFWKEKESMEKQSSRGISLQSEAQLNAQRRVGVKSASLIRPREIIFAGKQVFERSVADGLMNPLPSGANVIGKLLTEIDTRQQGQVVKVSLPYGARHKLGGHLPKDSTLYGTASPDGEAEKVFIRFHKVVFPDGKEFRFDAQALNSADYSPGLLGYKHSNAELKIASSIGLTMVSAASDVLTQRSALSAMGGIPIGMSSPDATVKNAILQGVSQVSRQEAQKQAQDLGNVPDYVTVPTGSDLIINILSPFNGEAI